MPSALVRPTQHFKTTWKKTVHAMLKKKYRNRDDDKQIGYMTLDGENENFIKGIKHNHEQYIDFLIEADKNQGLLQLYINMMIVAFNQYLNKFNDPILVPTKYLWDYHAPPLTVRIKEEVLSDGKQDVCKDAEFDLAKKIEELNADARDKGTSSNAIRDKSLTELVHPRARKLGRK
ncbi:hypothetical protein R1flu_013870 [Riccia fluitans]|uniref:Uncharacterized protein n=1 Tax=Riccia fluitans TaxID=41844 RepID=A0ABD1YHZ0_9MARC